VAAERDRRETAVFRIEVRHITGYTNRLFVEGHHMRHWADGGETKLENMVSVCSHHHRFVHEYGYTVRHVGKTEIEFIEPGGTVVVAAPEPAQPAARGWETIRARNADLETRPTHRHAAGMEGGSIWSPASTSWYARIRELEAEVEAINPTADAECCRLLGGNPTTSSIASIPRLSWETGPDRRESLAQRLVGATTGIELATRTIHDVPSVAALAAGAYRVDANPVASARATTDEVACSTPPLV